MEYITVKEAARKWGLTDRRVRILCADEKIGGVIQPARAYLIPADAQKPADGRCLRGKAVAAQYRALFAEIDGKRAELSALPPFTPAEAERLRDDFIVDYTYHSTAIEGNALTLKETTLVLGGLVVEQKMLKDHLEVIGHRDAYLRMLELLRNKEPLREETIRELHTYVLMDRPADRGIYRKIPLQLPGSALTPSRPEDIPGEMRRMMAENERKKRRLHPLERIAWFHLTLEGIHPFIRGNGRTGRLIMNYDLLQSGYPAVNLKVEDKKRYYDAFDVYFQSGDSSCMTLLIAEYVNGRLDGDLDMLKAARA